MRTTIQPNWPAKTQIKAYTTLRNGWSGRQSPDNHLNEGNESQQLKKLLQLPDEPIWITQNHGTFVIEATPENREKNADASFTQQLNRICVVLSADCLPILLCNQQGTYVAAIHAGWRGLANGIIEATLNASQQLASELLVWLGPAIGPQKFEVGSDVYDIFTRKHPEAEKTFTPLGKNQWLADLYALAKIRLGIQGVQHIFGGSFCTYTQNELFFSYRRDKGKTGRMASLIWISPDG